MSFDRATGVLLHPTCFPSRGGIGDLGPAAYEFINFLAAGRQSLWQVLPLSPVGYGSSPYSATSAFAGNPLLISLERLAERGWISHDELSGLPEASGAVDFPEVFARKLPLVERAAENFLERKSGGEKERFHRFCEQNAWWLEDFALFELLRRKHGFHNWNTWPRELAQREPEALARVRVEFARQLDVQRAVQFAFREQWRSLRAYCNARGIRIIGDVAIFVNYDSADVWTHPELFHLDERLEPRCVAGVPPDAFSATGQRWGNPLYDWERLRERGYDWWVRRMQWANAMSDIVRLDHFRGFESYWEIPAHEATAVNGRWVPGPRDALFDALRSAMGGELPFIAEDLGLITPEVNALRERLGMPGMKVLQFAFSDRGAHIYLPHRYVANAVVYTGTHDNDTTPGWWQHCVTAEEKRNAAAYLGMPEDGVHWAMIRTAMNSVASLCVIPLQDLLGLGSEARMNTPSRPDGNWRWRHAAGALRPELAQRLAHLAELSDRDGPALAAQQQGYREVGEEFAA